MKTKLKTTTSNVKMMKRDAVPSKFSSLHGDLVSALFKVIAVPKYSLQALELYESNHPKWPIALFLVISCILSGMVCCWGWYHNNLTLSRIGALFNIGIFAFLNHPSVQFPFEKECTITRNYQIGIIIGVLTNFSLSFQEKIIRMVAMFVIGSYISMISPYSDYTQDTLPKLGSSIILSVILLKITQYYQSMMDHRMILNWRIDHITVHAARIVLAAIFLHHTYNLLSGIDYSNNHNNSGENIDSNSNPAYQAMTDLIKVAVTASIGFAATGSFRKEIANKEELEVLVKQRTMQLQKQADKFLMVNLALQASETAIAITDSKRCIIWTNESFNQLQRMRKNQNSSRDNNVTVLGRPIASVLSLHEGDNSNQDATRTTTRKQFLKSFDIHSRIEDEIVLPHEGDNYSISEESKTFHLEVSPFIPPAYHHHDNEDESREKKDTYSTTEDDSTRFLVVFKDITADRKRQDAEKVAQEEAMMSKAMSDSMVTLTHELRTPLQGIMGVTSLLLQHENDDSDNKASCSGMSKDSYESLKLIMASSSLLLNLINNLLDVKKVSSKMMNEFPLSSIIASNSIRDAVDFCRPLASISNVTLEIDYGDQNDERQATAIVKSNALRLQQILINLISNGIKYTIKGSTIRITARSYTLGAVRKMMQNSIASSVDDNNDCCNHAEDNEFVLVFSVYDSGPGIASKEAHKLFRRYVQLDNQPSKSRSLGGNKIGQPSGTGLGLNLCQLFVQRMNGQIWATNNNSKGSDEFEDKGSTFSFYLPQVDSKSSKTNASNQQSSNTTSKPSVALSKQKSIAGNNHDTTQSNADNETASIFKRRVLLVDDILINRKVFDRMLRSVGVSHIKTVDSGHNALVELSEYPCQYDLVITDLQMPGMSGTELCGAITKMYEERSKNEHLSPPGAQGESASTASASMADCRPVVVGLTADTSPDVAGQCQGSGMADVIYKPITVAEMRDYFRTTLGHLKAGVWYKDECPSQFWRAQ